MECLLHVKSFMYFFPFVIPAALPHGHFYIVSLWTSEEIKSGRFNWFAQRPTVGNGGVGIWFQVFLNLRHWCLVVREKANHCLAISPPGICFLICEMKALGWEVTVRYLFTLFGAPCSQDSRVLLKKQTIWQTNHVKIHVFYFATPASICIPEHTILLFSNSNLGVGGIEVVLAP